LAERTASGESSIGPSAWTADGLKIKPATRAVIGIAARCGMLVKTGIEVSVYIQAIRNASQPLELMWTDNW
jgi:hypothetical protein